MRAFGGTLDVYEKTGGHGKRALTRTAGKVACSSDASSVGGRPPVFMSFWLTNSFVGRGAPWYPAV